LLIHRFHEEQVQFQVVAIERAGSFHLHEAAIDDAESVAPEDRRQIKWPLYLKAMSFGQSASEKDRVDDYLKKMQQLAAKRFGTPGDDVVSAGLVLVALLIEVSLDGSGRNAVAVGGVPDTCRLSRSTSAETASPDPTATSKRRAGCVFPADDDVWLRSTASPGMSCRV
jgi:hypothetical protein